MTNAPLKTTNTPLLAPLQPEIFNLSSHHLCQVHRGVYTETRLGIPQYLADMVAAAPALARTVSPPSPLNPRLEEHPLGVNHDNMLPFDELMRARWMGGHGNGVIMIPFTSGYHELLLNLLTSLKLAGVRLWKEVVIVPLDRLSMEVCRRQFVWREGGGGPGDFSLHCSSDTIRERPPRNSSEAFNEDSNDTPCCSDDWRGYIWFKSELVLRALALDRPLLLSDADVVYMNEHPLLRLVKNNNPLLGKSSDTHGVFMGSLDRSNVDYNIGVLFVKPTRETLQFFSQILTYRKVGLMQQFTINCFLHSAISLGMEVESLSKNLNPTCNPKYNKGIWPYVRSVHFCCIFPGTPGDKKAAMVAERSWLL